MEISNERLQEFCDAYKIDFGEDISLEDAREILSRLMTLYELLRLPLPGKPTEKDSTIMLHCD